MPWDSRFDKSALKDLQKLQPKLQKRILQAIEVISQDPYRKHNKIKRLEGMNDCFRFRLGDFRIIYLLDQDTKIMYVKAILRRNEKTYKPSLI